MLTISYNLVEITIRDASSGQLSENSVRARNSKKSSYGNEILGLHDENLLQYNKIGNKL